MTNLEENTEFRGVLPTAKVAATAKEKQYVTRRGLKFPFTSGGRGYVTQAVEVELAKINLTQLLKTTPGERVMLPRFGCDLESLLFEPFDEQLVLETKNRIVTSITNFIPYIQLNKVEVRRLNESTKFGLPTLYIKVSCQLKNDENTSFEVKVKL